MVAVLVVLVVVLAGTTIYFALSKNAFAPSSSQTAPAESMAGKIPAATNQTPAQGQNTTTSNLNPKIKSLDNKWNLYTNEQLGFSIKIPKQIYMGIVPEYKGNCPDKEGVNVFEDEKFVYISEEYSYSSKQEQCKRTNLESAEARNKAGTDSSGYMAGGWFINTDNAKNDQELLRFIKENLGDDCIIGAKKADQYQPEAFDITIGNKPQGECIMNFSYKFLYSPKAGKLVEVSMGQDRGFLLSPYTDEAFADTKSADEDMINSLRLLGI